jgi:repressor LexA
MYTSESDGMQRRRSRTNPQQMVLAFVNETVRDTGAPPTIREVMKHCGYKSPRSAHIHLKALVKCGLLVYERGVGRAFRARIERPASSVPIVGRAPAGRPLDQPEEPEGTLPLPWGVNADAFAVHVEGDSMIDAHILAGDLVVVDRDREARDGSVVLARVDGAQTIKRLQKRGRKLTLKAANRAHSDVEPRRDDDEIIGCVVALVRKIGS